MIVDIAIDTDGKQMYQVHETSKLVRKEMPKSTHFAGSSMGSFDLYDGSRTIVDRNTAALPPHVDSKMRGSLSGHSLPDLILTNQKGDFEEEDENPESSQVGSGGSSSENIWSKEVENAFEEVLAIVPKIGLNKIKVGGRSCGRNELISDYILAKTGKFRSRKQVSSHLQVIKNMGVKKDLIKLINDGPTFSSPEEMEENTRRFEEIFTEINLNRSLGRNSKFSPESSTGPVRRHSSVNLSSAPKRRNLPESFVGVRDICFSIENVIMGSSPIYLSMHDDAPATSLTVNENAAISSRFPGLEEFADTNVPIIHNMVRIHSPLQLPSNLNIESGLKTSYMLVFGSPSSQISSFTSVYSFGNEVLNVNEENFQVNTNQPFLLKFWKCFFLQLLHQPASLDAAFKGITVKQVIYQSIPGLLHMVPKSNIRAVLLWEFAKVDDFKLARSSTSRLYLPQTLGFASLSLDTNNYYTPGHHVQMPTHLSPGEPLEPNPFFKREDVQVGAQEPELNFSIQNPFPTQAGQNQEVIQQPYGFHPSANVNLGSIRIKDDTEFATFY